MQLAHRTGVSCLDHKSPRGVFCRCHTFWPGCQFLDLEGTVRLVSSTDSEAGDVSFTQASSPVSVMLTVSPLLLSVVCALGQVSRGQSLWLGQKSEAKRS